MIYINPQCSLGDDELSYSYSRSGGPGGQNVNKVSTAARLRFDIVNSPSIPFDVKQRLIKICGSRVTQDGELVIHADVYRTQEQNRIDAFERLVEFVNKSFHVPKKRKKTKASKSAVRQRVDEKKKHGAKKNLRRVSPHEVD